MDRCIIALALLITLSLACNYLSPSTSPTLVSQTINPTTQPSMLPSTLTAIPETIEPKITLTNPGSPESEIPYITFVINTHDWTHPDESAQILLELIDLFEKYGVRSDFYFTAEITRALAEHHPEVVERFKDSNMTISYHVRPPHPFYYGFKASLDGLNKAAAYQTLLDYETYAVDLATGDLDRSRAGGYAYVTQVFGCKPVVVPRHQVYADLGGQMTLLYHEEGTKIEQPFETIHGMLVRPSDFSITRNTIIDGTDNFWWNMVSASNGADYHPLHLLKLNIADWESRAYQREPFITSLIHENNFYRSGPVGWTSYYYDIEHGKRAEPLSPPYDLNAPDSSHPRSEKDKDAIWRAYEELVAYAAQNLNVVTSEDILRMAKGSP